MKRAGKNIIAAGLAMLLISAAFAFQASGATTYKSHAEAQFLSGTGPLGDVVGQLGDALENNGVVACEPARSDCPEESFVTSPLDPLGDVTGPAGDGIGMQLGAVNNYAVAGKYTPGKSLGASGAVDDNGIIREGGQGGIPSGGATLDLSAGALAPLATELSNLQLQLGAISATAELAPPDYAPVRDYNIEGGEIVLTVPALADINTALGGAISAELADPLVLNATAICNLLTGLAAQGTPPAGLPALPAVPCSDAATLDPILTGQITGLSSVTGGLTNVTSGGITFDFTTGEITIDIDAALLALGKDINNLPPNANLLEEILPSLVLNLDDLIASFKADLIDEVFANAQLEGTFLLAPFGPFALSQLSEAGIGGAFDELFDGLDTAIDGAAGPLSDGLVQIVDGLNALLQINVHVPDLYTTTGLVSGDSVSTAAANQFYSETSVRIQVAQGQLADLRLATAQVGPNSAVTDVDADAVADADAQADADADTQADAVSDADADVTDADNVSDADADASVMASLPNTGSAPNMLPLIILALALIALGTGILVNEKRRLETE